jgi:HAMP domain-containing protein
METPDSGLPILGQQTHAGGAPKTNARTLGRVLEWDIVGWAIAALLGFWGAMVGMAQFAASRWLLYIAGACVLVLFMRLAWEYRRLHHVWLLLIALPLVTVAIAEAFMYSWTNDRIRETAETARKLKNLDTIPRLNESLAKLQTTLSQSEIGRQADMIYMKTKLDDAYRMNDQLRQLAPALMKVATASETYVQKEYEAKQISNQRLRELTQSICKKLRALQTEWATTDEQITRKYENIETAILAKPLTEEERRKELGDVFMPEVLEKRSAQNKIEQEYRNTVMTDAQYARRELLSRIGGDEFLPPSERSRAMALDGVMAGPDP